MRRYIQRETDLPVLDITQYIHVSEHHSVAINTYSFYISIKKLLFILGKVRIRYTPQGDVTLVSVCFLGVAPLRHVSLDAALLFIFIFISLSLAHSQSFYQNEDY